MTKEELITQCTDELRQTFADMLSRAYDQGFADATSNEDETSTEEPEWVNLGFPSGNLWAVAEKRCPYPDENQYLPTEDDIQELLIGMYFDVAISTTNNLWPSIDVKGLNGTNLIAARFGWWPNSSENRDAFNRSHKEEYVWIKSELGENFTRKCLKITIPRIPAEGNPKDVQKPSFEFVNRYSGENSVLLLCKKK